MDSIKPEGQATSGQVVVDSRRFAWWLLLSCLLVCAIAAALGIHALEQGYHQRILQAEVRSQNMAEAVDKTIGATFEKADLALRNVIDVLEQDLATRGILFERANALIARQLSYVPELEGMRATNVAGDVIFGTGVETPGAISYQDRDFFKLQSTDNQAGLVVTQPIFGRVAQKWVISLNRRYNMPDGTFAGVVVVSVPVENLRQVLSSFDMGARGVINIRSVTDQRLVVRFPEKVNGHVLEIGDNNVSQELKDALASGQASGTFHALSPYDNTQRVFTFHRLEKAPFVVLAGLAEADFLADWLIERDITIGLVAAFLLLTLLAGRMIWVLWRRQSRTAVQLQESNRELAAHRSDLEQRVAVQTAELAAANQTLVDTQFAMDCVGIGIHWVDAASGQLLHANKFAAALLGYSVEEFLQLGVPDIDPGFESGSFAERTQFIREQKSAQFETVNRARDGRLIPIEAIIYFLEGRDGEPDRFITFVKDITSRQAQARALLEAKEAAEEANRAKSAFLANMSHEIRTPMNAIVGFTHLLRRDQLTPLQAERVGRIATATEHLLAVISDILDISKIEAGKLLLEEVEFDLDQLLERVSSIIALRTQEKDVELILDVHEVPQFVRGDPTRLSQVLINFLGNAVKFTHSGIIVLRGRVLVEQGGARMLHFEVEDSGIGIAPESLGQIFNAFEQGHASTTRSFGGTGLGLSINKRIVELMKGRVGVTSQLGVGSKFWLTIPLLEGAQPRPPFLPTEWIGQRVLLADDQAATRVVLGELLASFGFRLTLADTGAGALAAIVDAERQGEPFSLVLFDLRSGAMSGLEALREVQALVLPHPPRCVLLSLAADASEIEAARQAGFADVLMKPLSRPVLRAWFARLSSQANFANGSAEQPGRKALGRFAGARVLLAEDDAINQLIACEMLEELELVVTVVDDGQKLLEQVASQRFDLILSDLQMPVMDGLEAARLARRMPNGQTVPIIAMTANAFAEDRARCLAAGMNDFVSKPVDPEALFATLARWLMRENADSVPGEDR